MDFLEYDIKDNGAFAPFISTMEDTGADIEGSRVMFEGDNSAAKMLADTLVEYEIMSPVMEAEKKVVPAAGGETPASAPAPTATVEAKPAAAKKVAAEKAAVAKTAAKKPVAEKAPAEKASPAAKAEAPAAPPEVKAKEKAAVPAEEKGTGDAEVAGVAASEGDSKVEKIGTGSDAGEKAAPAEDPYKKEVYQNIIEKIESLGLDEGMVKAIEQKVTGFIDANAEKSGDNASEYYAKLADNPANAAKLIFGVIQKADPELFEELKNSGKLNEKNENTASIAQKTELAKQISDIVGQIEVPDAFNVEIDDSEWDNAVVTSFGFPMINLTSTLVREMLRSQDPKTQKRAYKEFKKQLKSDRDIANALGIGVSGVLGIGGKKEASTDKDTRIETKTESVGDGGNTLVEGPIDAIKNVKKAFQDPVDVLKSIAKNRGTPCHRNNLVVMHKDIDGKAGDSTETVNAIPLGVSGGTLVDLNKSVPVPMAHLSAFYSVVDPRASFKSYAKAMAEVNKKSDNADKGLKDAAASVGKKLLSKIPLLGSSAKKELEAEEADGITAAMGELATYIKENGHPPFYLLKPKSEPKEVDYWSDEDAAHGYQMITMMVDGHKAGMIMKGGTAEALFKVG